MTLLYYGLTIYATFGLLTGLFAWAAMKPSRIITIVMSSIFWPIFWYVGVITYLQMKDNENGRTSRKN